MLQGTTHGTLLFVFFVSDLVEHLSKNCAPILYTVDTNIIVVSPTLQTALVKASVTAGH